MGKENNRREMELENIMNKTNKTTFIFINIMLQL